MTDTSYTENAAGPTTSDEHRAAGHWLLAKMGKKVLRPGGIELTRKLLTQLNIGTGDKVVELGPGIGRTAEIVLAGNYATYIGVDPNQDARAQIAKVLAGHHDASVVQGDARNNGLPDASADLVISEAMLTMQSAADKQKIADEVFRTLAPGGRWGMHEMSLRPDDVDQSVVDQISKALSRTIKVGARPLTAADWTKLVTDAGFELEWQGHNSMRLVDPTRIIADEGLRGALRFFNNVRRNPEARKRILAMRKVFHDNQQNLGAIALVARKPA
ncbi:class I SAM-dependent methyltransferase [Propionimicrobium sp. PCR01-08-3]|uniref:class I SAM-dependent methyltransferase n=1 Tax=Propionimicrobium sp. PCR01-08-3 TaxID=3052086 RepID=UPI00255CD198|nr:class I SAM-dependent methyltransferase [Propionimicrobium sp. PCR01-08-3]WIY83602.1 class I SAM-dependent methyltransferase [Propionimicrobium sp. PCR01-08-3]